MDGLHPLMKLTVVLRLAGFVCGAASSGPELQPNGESCGLEGWWVLTCRGTSEVTTPTCIRNSKNRAQHSEVYLRVCPSMWVFYICICVCVYVHVHVYVYVCAYVRMCACVKAHSHFCAGLVVLGFVFGGFLRALSLFGLVVGGLGASGF